MAMSDQVSHQLFRKLRPAFWLVGLLIVASVAGCRFNVAILRGIIGDFEEPSAFEQRLDVDLSKGNHRLLILCSAGHGVTNESASLPIDILSKVSGRLRSRGIDVVDSDDVANWLDDNGSWDDLTSLAAEFDADYIAVIHVQNLTFKEPNSTNLFRARASGDIRVYEVLADEDGYVAERYGTAINEVYPKTYPISAEKTSEGMFQKQTLDYLSDIFARQFHSYHQRETI